MFNFYYILFILIFNTITGHNVKIGFQVVGIYKFYGQY